MRVASASQERRALPGDRFGMRARMAFLACLAGLSGEGNLGQTVGLVRADSPPAQSLETQANSARDVDGAGWNDLVGEVRRQALQYIDSLPDFICIQTTRRYIDPTGTGEWSLQDTIEAELTFHGKRESYSNIRVNERPISKPLDSLGGTISFGEFGSISRVLFLPETQARFWREGQQSFGGRRTIAIGFAVQQANSSWTLSFKNSHSLKVAYEGQTLVDEESRQVLKITQQAQNLPTNFPIGYCKTITEYGLISVKGIPGSLFLLPLRAELTSQEKRSQHTSRNVTEFQNYRKFTSDVRLIPD
jgi:hypothetical protein